METTLKPARLVSPGSILKKELAVRGWTQKELARRLKRPQQAVNEIIKGGKQVTPQTAISLAKVMGTSLEFWWNLETNYRFRLALASKASSSDKEIDRAHMPYVHAA
jgi:HTH-type transcriptional regulator/antitoxin HigA